MPNSSPQTIYLKDYTAPAFWIDTVDLHFTLDANATVVRAQLAIRRNGDHTQPLRLDGDGLQLLSVQVDSQDYPADCYQATPESLVLHGLPDACCVQITTQINPAANTQLMGLYQSNGRYFTQCEAEGFRRITYYLDRPDVLAVFTTTIVADAASCPVLLSNGNPIAQGANPDGTHWVTWQDPFPKPSYLFALVAGDLACLRGHYQTASGRPVLLEIYAEPQDIDKCQHAMQSLKDAMRWDEQVYGLEYDLDRYMIVAVGDFNMGAMENKGLNVFNTKYVLASPDAATDADYDGIASVIAHEYFHNWTGNRVTCRDWFQLSLKEGLTVFRDQCFSADMGSKAVARIEDVKVLRAAQFTEDAGAMAHPIRPQQYMEINNFYTATVYEKGAEVIRMLHTLLGEQGFLQGMRLYFERHDGQAVTTEDFLAAMADANGQDLSQFQHWYDYAGTPVLSVRDTYDEQNQTYTLIVEQTCPPTPEASHKPPFLIPLAIGLLDEKGQDIPLSMDEDADSPTTRILQVKHAQQSFTFTGVPCKPVPSLLRHFSAPVRVDYPYSAAQRAFLAAYDSDAFNRWDALQQLAVQQIRDAMRQTVDFTPLQQAFMVLLQDNTLDPAFKALALTLPSEAALADGLASLDVDALLNARQSCERVLAQSLQDIWLQQYEACQQSLQGDVPAGLAKGLRALSGVCLGYLAQSGAATAEHLCAQHFKQAGNMTDALAALRALNDTAFASRATCLETFYQRWQVEALVVDKWLALHASCRQPNTLQTVQNLLNHSSFSLSNPNKVRNLIGVFSQNWSAFHRIDGAGYAFLADYIIALNQINPQIAARLCGAYSRWRVLDPQRQTLILAQLDRILSQTGVSPDVYEMASKYRKG